MSHHERGDDVEGGPLAGAGRARKVGAQVGYDAGRVERAALYQDDDGRTQLAKKALEAAGRIYAPDNRTCAKKEISSTRAKSSISSYRYSKC